MILQPIWLKIKIVKKQQDNSNSVIYNYSLLIVVIILLKVIELYKFLNKETLCILFWVQKLFTVFFPISLWKIKWSSGNLKKKLKIDKSQNHRMIDIVLDFMIRAWSHPVPVRPPKTGCPVLCLNGIWISPRWETPWPF